MEYRPLEITVMSADDLRNVNMITKMDVYVVVSIPTAKRQRTHVDKSGGRSPSWNHRLTFSSPSPFSLLITTPPTSPSRSSPSASSATGRSARSSSPSNSSSTIPRRPRPPAAVIALPIASLIIRYVQILLQIRRKDHSADRDQKSKQGRYACHGLPAATGNRVRHHATTSYGTTLREPGRVSSSTARVRIPTAGVGGGYPPAPAYGYPPQPQAVYGSYGYGAPVGQQGKKKKMGGGKMGMGMGLGAGLLGGMLLGDMMSDAGEMGAYDAGFDSGF
ncbi:hypothetical protein C3L33_09101, partial [Rhododendron williamsianum]